MGLLIFLFLSLSFTHTYTDTHWHFHTHPVPPWCFSRGTPPTLPPTSRTSEWARSEEPSTRRTLLQALASPSYAHTPSGHVSGCSPGWVWVLLAADMHWEVWVCTHRKHCSTATAPCRACSSLILGIYFLGALYQNPVSSFLGKPWKEGEKAFANCTRSLDQGAGMCPESLLWPPLHPPGGSHPSVPLSFHMKGGA